MAAVGGERGGGMMEAAACRPPLSFVVVVAVGTRIGEMSRSRRPGAFGGRFTGPGGNLAADGVSITVEDKEVDAAGGPPRPTLRFLLFNYTCRLFGLFTDRLTRRSSFGI